MTYQLTQDAFIRPYDSKHLDPGLVVSLMSDSERPGEDGPTAETGGSIRAEFDWSVVPPSTAVVETVAIAADREPTALEPLYDTVDPDALDTLFSSMGTKTTDGDATVRFALDGYEVTVERHGTVVVRPDEARAESE